MKTKKQMGAPWAGLAFGCAAVLAGATARAAQSGYAALPTLTVDGQVIANPLPTGTYASPVSQLEYDPRIDLQSRNMPEAQGDVSIRGGIFENTGFRLGAATLFDPQTGHYFAEIPVAPEMLERPSVLTGADNALHGFNSSVGTIDYGWSRIAEGGSLTAGAGDHDLNYQRLHSAWTGALKTRSEWTWGAEGEVSRSESDGTVPFGDHDFNRYNARVQLAGPESQTDLFAGYQSKFFGWPNLYTPYGNETENLKTRLFLLNHAQEYGDGSEWEATAYHRRHSDLYFLDAFGGITIEHETKVSAVALDGRHVISDAAALAYAAQATKDEIESTSLEQGDFTSRRYLKLALVPEFRSELDSGAVLTVRAGGALDDTNRDGSDFSPIGEVSWKRTREGGDSERIYLSYAEATQVAGYTAIGGSETGGLFRSNHGLGRETSRNLELGTTLERGVWTLEGAIFHRRDDNLTDWTFTNGSPNARSANPVDIETFGVELIATRHWETVEALVSYAYLHKSEDYGSSTIDASFYALNFPEHRVTAALIWRPLDLLEVRADNEWRTQEENNLRKGGDEAFYTHLAVVIRPPRIESLELNVAVDNLWDEEFEEVPGTPGRGRQVSAGATWRW